MAKFVFDQIGGRCKLVDEPPCIRCTGDQIAAAEKVKAEKARKMKKQEERQRTRCERESLVCLLDSSGLLMFVFSGRNCGFKISWDIIQPQKCDDDSHCRGFFIALKRRQPL